MCESVCRYLLACRFTDPFVQVIAKVYNKMDNLQRISGSVWGPNLKSMRQLYITTIRPIFTYACGAWFINSAGEKKVNHQLSQALINQLESAQYYCLTAIAGAMSGTSRQVLEKELHINSLEVTLRRIATTQRARALDTPEHAMLCAIRSHNKQKSRYNDHPYHVLDVEARALLNDTISYVECKEGDLDYYELPPRARAKCLKEIAVGNAKAWSEELWDKYRRERAQVHPHPTTAVDGTWGSDNKEPYVNLSRAQSTLLLQLRTEVVGLNAYLHPKTVSRPIHPLQSLAPLTTTQLSDTPLCTCGKSRQTVFHMFIQCETLRTARSDLFRELGHTDLAKMLTDKPIIAVDWAITHFNLSQFESAKEYSQFKPTVEPSPFLPHIPFSQTLHDAIALFMGADSSVKGQTSSSPIVESSPSLSPTLFSQTLQEAVALFKGVDSSD